LFRFEINQEAPVFQLTPVVWIVAGLILAALEMIVPGLVIIWFGVAGVITGLLAILVHNPYVQFGVFIALAAVLVVFSQRIARRITHPEPEPVGANRMQNAIGLVVQDITPPDLGRVKVNGDEWRAEAKTEIARGTKVRVLGVEGTHLMVERLEEGSDR
jgi:membrane protein implicated in regulation of membrane protease activity